MAKPSHIDRILRDWPYEPGDVRVRKVRGADGRELLQMRIDLGLLQLEVEGRPDGYQPEGFPTYYDYLVSLAFHEGEEFDLDEERCSEVDREFVQFYHRRICWLALRQFHPAVKDADHTLGLMDFSSAHAPDPDWALSHEQYRPFVLFHRTQAAALAAVEEGDGEQAVTEIDAGLERLRELFDDLDEEEDFDEDELAQRLIELKESLREHFKIGPTLDERLAQAVASEQYELAAKLRDEIDRRNRP